MDYVRYEVTDGHIATITYDRPARRNAIDGAMRRDINEAFERFRYDDEAWVGIVTSTDPAFCAGADLRSEWEIYKPLIAAVNGPCVGYGLTLVTWCDFVIASEKATF